MYVLESIVSGTKQGWDIFILIAGINNSSIPIHQTATYPQGLQEALIGSCFAVIQSLPEQRVLVKRRKCCSSMEFPPLAKDSSNFKHFFSYSQKTTQKIKV